MRVVGDGGERVQEKTDRRTGRVYRYPVSEGKIPEDWWTDIETLNHSDRERTGYPSQKPERLVERILRPSPCLAIAWRIGLPGQATTAAVAQRLARAVLSPWIAKRARSQPAEHAFRRREPRLPRLSTAATDRMTILTAPRRASVVI